MNSIWNKNISLLEQRFPSLCQLFNISAETLEPETSLYEIIPSKTNLPSAKWNSLLLHSAWNPEREAQNTVKSARKEDLKGAIFFSMGLGYTPLEWARLFPQDTLIIVEKNPEYFFEALRYTDFEQLFSIPNLILALNATQEQVVGLVNHAGGFKSFALIENKSQSQHQRSYFDSLIELKERNQKKDQINAATLDKFSRRWLRNLSKNLYNFSALQGINIYQDKCPQDLPALILAAGPTLKNILPYLKQIKNKVVIIAVDTALRVCLKSGVEPDFIVLTDPQYYAWRHIAGLNSPSSILITESAAYPPVYRFNCRKTVLCSSLFALGQYFERKTEIKGELKSGGSVATTAWDFARYAGFKTIYCAGLDLSYPALETHIKGSLFEEQSHRLSNRFNCAEKQLSTSLFAANAVEGTDYSGNKVLTDQKMKMFAWWFESRQSQFPEIISYSLSEKSLKIPKFKTAQVNSLLNLEDKTRQKETFLSQSGSSADNNQNFSLILNELTDGLEELYETAKKGFYLSDKALSLQAQDVSDVIEKLNAYDEKILHSQYKEIASLVFPSEGKLQKIFDQTVFPQDKTRSMLLHSRIVYSLLMDSIKDYLYFLKK